MAAAELSWPLSAAPAAPPELSGTRLMDCLAHTLIEDLPELVLRPLFRHLWQQRYGVEWANGSEAGEAVLCGLGGADSYTESLGMLTFTEGQVTVIAERDLRRSIPDPAQQPPSGQNISNPLPALRDRGSFKVKSADGSERVLWVDGNVQKQKAKSGGAPLFCFKLNEPFVSQPARAAPLAAAAPPAAPPTKHRCEGFVKDRAFFDRHAAGSRSAISSPAAQAKLAPGVLQEYDLTALLFLLLNSGHDGQQPDPADPTRPAPQGLAHPHPAVRGGLSTLRRIRNNQIGHVEAWSLGWDTFAKVMDSIDAEVAASIDAEVAGFECRDRLRRCVAEALSRVMDEHQAAATKQRFRDLEEVVHEEASRITNLEEIVREEGSRSRQEARAAEEEQRRQEALARRERAKLELRLTEQYAEDAAPEAVVTVASGANGAAGAGAPAAGAQASIAPAPATARPPPSGLGEWLADCRCGSLLPALEKEEIATEEDLLQLEPSDVDDLCATASKLTAKKFRAALAR